MLKAIRQDLQAVFDRDPAATSRLEVILTYAGFHALLIYRIAHWLKVGAQPSDRVAKFLATAELMTPRERREQTKKPQPRAKAQERLKAAAAASEKEAAAS